MSASSSGHFGGATASLLALTLAACSSSKAGDTSGTSGGAAGSGVTVEAHQADVPFTKDLQGRSYQVKVPTSYDAKAKAPLVVLIHGYVSEKTAPQDIFNYMQVGPAAESRGVIVALPLGTHDPVLGKYEWNATDACCGWNTPTANDVGYVMAMIDEIKAKYSIDEKRIYVFGHSNGGFMANRLACDQASQFAGMASLAGMPYKDHEKCHASAPIAMLHVHGDADTTVLFNGGPPYGITAFPPAPSAANAAAMWAAKNGCVGGVDTSEPAVDLVTDLPGAETGKKIYKGCEANGDTELWTIHGGPHSPSFSNAWAGAVLDFLLAHPKS